jgi:thiamine pyrophosphokinase
MKKAISIPHQLTLRNAQKEIGEFVRAQLFTYDRLQIVGPMPAQLKSIPTLFVDGGIKHRNQIAKSVPRISFGDGDSSSISPDILVSSKKDISDLSLCLGAIKAVLKSRKLTQAKNSSVYILVTGFLGGRKDHELVNFGELYWFLKGATESNSRISITLDSNFRYLDSGSHNLYLKGEFSVLAFEKTKIEVSGNITYPFNGTLKPFVSLGLSNVGHGRFKITTQNPVLLCQN